MPGIRQASAQSLKQQICLLERRVLDRRFLLHGQVGALHQQLREKLSASIVIFLMSSVVFVLGLTALRPRTASKNHSAKKANRKRSGVWASLELILVKSLRLFASILAVVARLIDVMNIITFLITFPARYLANTTNTHHNSRVQAAVAETENNKHAEQLIVTSIASNEK